MAKTKALTPDELLQRRELVAQLASRHMTVREIADNMARISRGRFSIDKSTVNRDLIHLRKEWRENASRTAADWISAELADLEELERQAWKDGDLNQVLVIKRDRAAYLRLHDIDVGELGLKARNPVQITVNIGNIPTEIKLDEQAEEPEDKAPDLNDAPQDQ